MNNKGVSAIIGVVLMVAITVAIACTVYVYVSSMTDKEYTGILEEIKEEAPYLILTFRDYTELKFKTYLQHDLDKLEVDHGYIITYNTYRQELISIENAGVLLE